MYTRSTLTHRGLWSLAQQNLSFNRASISDGNSGSLLWCVGQIQWCLGCVKISYSVSPIRLFGCTTLLHTPTHVRKTILYDNHISITFHLLGSTRVRRQPSTRRVAFRSSTKWRFFVPLRVPRGMKTSRQECLPLRAVLHNGTSLSATLLEHIYRFCHALLAPDTIHG